MKTTALKYFFLLVFPFFMLFSCSSGGTKNQYPVYSDSERFSVDSSAFSKEYKNGDEVNFETLKVTFDNKELVYSENINEDDDHFYVIADPASPNVIIMNHSLASSNKETSTTNIYVAVLLKGTDETAYYVSEPITLTITNPNALKPWVLYTVSGVVILAIVGFSFFKGKKNAKGVKNSQTFEDKPTKAETENKQEKVDVKIEEKKEEQTSDSDDAEM